jgi:hypothetical protein
MVIFEDVLRALLVQLNLVDKRVYLIRAPQKPTVPVMAPYIVFQHVGPVPLHSLRAPLDVLQRDYQISIFDNSQSRALGIADSLRTRMDGMTGDYLGIHFGAILYRYQTSGYEADTELYTIVLGFDILFQYLGNFPVIDPLTQHERQHKRI